MRTRLLALSAILALPAFACAQTGYSITGGLSNFDCHNHCDDPCDEFEIEIEDIRPEDVIHTYHNGNYGAPAVVLSTTGTFTIIDYRNPQHLTPVGAVEHFGISLRQLGPTNTIRVRWMRNGQPAAVNGHIPLPGGGSAPASQPLLPSIVAELISGSSGGDSGGVSLTVTNNDPFQSIWIQRRAQIMQGAVTLESLMPDNAVVATSLVIDNVPIQLAAGQSVSLSDDLVEVEDRESVIFTAEYFQDLFVGGPFGSTHQLGPALGNVMTASIAGPDLGCSANVATIVAQPQSVNGPAGREIAIQVNADSNDGTPLTYQWLKEGVELVNSSRYHGVTTDELSIDPLDAASEGFYAVRISNACGTLISDSALVFITGHNILRAPLAITADPALSTVSIGDTVTITAIGAFVPPTTTFQWFFNGSPLAEGDQGASVGGGFVTGASGPADPMGVALTIDNVQASDAGAYTVVFTNAGGSATSNPATIAIAAPVCPADFNADGALDPDDLSDYIAVFFTDPGSPAADFNLDGFVDPDDLADFIGAYFAGC